MNPQLKAIAELELDEIRNMDKIIQKNIEAAEAAEGRAQ
jgi:hypothetical protein